MCFLDSIERMPWLGPYLHLKCLSYQMLDKNSTTTPTSERLLLCFVKMICLCWVIHWDMTSYTTKGRLAIHSRCHSNSCTRLMATPHEDIWVQKILKRLAEVFYWHGMKRDAGCLLQKSQWSKEETLASSLLQPRRMEISMSFIN